MQHKPVLLHETLEYLDIQKSDIVIDGTLGGGGHSKEFSKRLGVGGILIGIDRDADALKRTKEILDESAHKTFLVQGNFRNIDKILSGLGIKTADKIFFDLGLSSFQLEESNRGFSFKKDEPLVMTFEKNPTDTQTTAYDIVNNWEEENIADILYGFGEERFSRRIARNIVTERKEKSITTTIELLKIIEKSVPFWYRRKHIHEATKTFQAIRIAVNDEMGAIKDGIEKSIKHLSIGGLIGVIAFHSIEDRLVKNIFRQLASENAVRIITKRPVVPAKEEIIENKRSRSAKLRVAEKT